MDGLNNGFKAALKRAGIEDFRFHDLRHTFASHFVMRGGDLKALQEILGHKTLTMTMRYAHHCPESLRSSIEVLNACYSFADTGTEGSLPKSEKSFKIKHGSV